MARRKEGEMNIGRIGIGLAIVGLATGLALAGDEPPMPKPTEGHMALEMWVGEWSGSGTMKEGPYGPGGPVTWTEKCKWFGGAKFNVVCRSKGNGPMGEMTGLGIMGFNPETGKFTHYGIDSMGWTGHSMGTREGDTFTFESKETMGGETMYSRMKMTMVSPNKWSFSWETSMDGETWTVMMEGVTEKAS